eukprot:TRINITY_DN8948_c0_g1_i4.p2 TRINITY_DN8948_c0_g1~~TRINITY_DN8948_c0_g1_i4.p2  ORF type:complete len:125 (-),score=21.45 TRINITY_DN8948_c0_g1_i4:100-474(-)
MWTAVLRDEKDKFFNIFSKISDMGRIMCVPIRVVEMGSTSQKIMHQYPYPIQGDSTTFGHFLREVFPGSVCEGTDDKVTFTGTVKISIQGILPPLEASLLWLVQHLLSTDNFLYVVCNKQPKLC